MGFIRVLYGAEDLADRLWRGPEWLRPAVGGVLLGLLLLALPQLYGVGYPVLEGAVRGNIVVGLLVALLVGKVVATSLTIAIGGLGGVFAPSLFMGAMLGSLAGAGGQALFGAGVAPAGAYGLVGMGALFAAAARAPITAVIIIFELTGAYTIILPLMTVVVVRRREQPALARHHLHAEAAAPRYRRDPGSRRRPHARHHRRRGDDAAARPGIARGRPLRTDRAPARRATRCPPRDRRERRVPGVVTSRRVDEAMGSNALDVTADSLLTIVEPVPATATLHDALGDLVQRSRGGIPVADNGELVGWLTHGDVLSAYHRRLQTSVGAAVQRPRPVGAAPRLAVPRLGDFRIVEVTLGAGAPAGRCVRDVAWPESSLVLAIRRGAEIVVAHGDTELHHGDRLSILLPSGAAADLADLVSAPAVTTAGVKRSPPTGR